MTSEETILESLAILEKAKNYNQWLVNNIRPYLSETILEIGAGTGNITEYLKWLPCVYATDLSIACANSLRSRFKNNPNIFPEQFDLMRPNSLIGAGFSTVVAFNVIEHIDHDVTAMFNILDLLKKGGYACILVPAHQALYSKLDENAGHFKRYSKREVEKLMLMAGFEIVKSRYLNMVSVIPWLINFKLLQRTKLPEKQVNLFNYLAPFLRLEKYFRAPFGLSVLVVGKK